MNPLLATLARPRAASLAPLGALCAAVLSLAATAGSGAGPDVQAGDPPARNLAIHCGTLYAHPGAAPLRGAWLIVRDGRVQSIVETGGPPDDLPVVDASDKVVFPGLVAADSDLSGIGDDAYNVTPDFSALDGFDFVREQTRALAGGVTTAYLAPGRNRLVPGKGAVVKLAGDDLVERVLAEDACLRITLGAAANAAPPVFEPVVAPTADDPLEPARRQYPSARLSQLETLRELFQEAARAPEGALEGAAYDGDGFVETRYDPRPLKLAARGDLALRVAAREAADAYRALTLATELGVRRFVLEDPYEIEPIARELAAGGARAVFRMPVLLSDSNPGGENRSLDTAKQRLDNPAIAARAGIPVALAAARDRDLPDLLMLAGIAVRYGLDRDAALAAVTSTAADVLGVADRVGSLEVGHDADFLVLSGDPLAVGTMVEQTWVGGERAFVRETGTTLLAVLADRIHTATGDVIDSGVLLVRDGRIKAVGSDLAVPYGARVIDLRGSGSVMVPGFIDAHSSLGLSGDRGDVPPGAANQRIDEVVRPDDPVFAAALRAGVTTVLTSGPDRGVVAGRVAAIKLGAADRESMIVSAIAAQRFAFDALGEDALKPITDQLERAKKYVEAWKKYEEALAAWQRGEGAKPKEEPKAEPAPAAKDDSLSGTWDCEIDFQGRFQIQLRLVLTLDGEKVTGKVSVNMQGREAPEQDVSGTFKDGKLALKLRFMGPDETELAATIANDTLNGTITTRRGETAVTGKRVAKGGEKPPAAASRSTEASDGRPEKPKVDEALEPLRAVLEGRAVAVIRCDKAPAISAVVELFRKEKLRFVLQGANDAVDTPELLGDEPAPVMVGPELVVRERGRLVNRPATLADADVPVILVTGDTAGSSVLPLHAAHAIRYGLSPEVALAALTIEPARAFGIDSRVGSLARGKDADFTVFDGSPFEPTSRPLLVVCNGRVVFDARETERSPEGDDR
ncbi:MAG: amidohydrolase family protein [Planctomycetes bacterium]|nr:amidohydrolase family protein [Planctomycetota bacterium]